MQWRWVKWAVAPLVISLIAVSAVLAGEGPGSVAELAAAEKKAGEMAEELRLLKRRQALVAQVPDPRSVPAETWTIDVAAASALRAYALVELGRYCDAYHESVYALDVVNDGQPTGTWGRGWDGAILRVGRSLGFLSDAGLTPRGITVKGEVPSPGTRRFFQSNDRVTRIVLSRDGRESLLYKMKHCMPERELADELLKLREWLREADRHQDGGQTLSLPEQLVFAAAILKTRWGTLDDELLGVVEWIAKTSRDQPARHRMIVRELEEMAREERARPERPRQIFEIDRNDAIQFAREAQRGELDFSVRGCKAAMKGANRRAGAVMRTYNERTREQKPPITRRIIRQLTPDYVSAQILGCRVGAEGWPRKKLLDWVNRVVEPYGDDDGDDTDTDDGGECGQAVRAAKRIKIALTSGDPAKSGRTDYLGENVQELISGVLDNCGELGPKGG